MMTKPLAKLIAHISIIALISGHWETSSVKSLSSVLR